MAEKKEKLKELLNKIEELTDTYFYEKTENCNFENYEYVSKEIESMVKDVIGTCRVEIKYLDNEIDNMIYNMEEEKEEELMENLSKYHIYNLPKPSDNIFDF